MSNAFAVGELLFFDGAQRKVTKRKGAFPTQLPRCMGRKAIFRLAIHGSVGKRRTSCAPPSGSADDSCEQPFLESTDKSVWSCSTLRFAFTFDSRCESLTRSFARPQRGGVQDVRRFQSSLKIVEETRQAASEYFGARRRAVTNRRRVHSRRGYFSLRPFKEK